MSTVHKARPRMTHRRLGPRSAGIPMTAAEFDAFPAERCNLNYRYELINGVLVVSPLARAAERGPNEELGFVLRLYQRTDPRGAALDDTLPEHTVIGTANRRRCDRAIWIGLGRTPDEDVDPPTILVEFVSRGKRGWERDYLTKRNEYGETGAREYWIFDRFERRLTVVRYEASGPVEIVVPETGRYETPLLPGFVLSVLEIMARADAWPDRRRKKSGDGK